MTTKLVINNELQYPTRYRPTSNPGLSLEALKNARNEMKVDEALLNAHYIDPNSAKYAIASGNYHWDQWQNNPWMRDEGNSILNIGKGNMSGLSQLNQITGGPSVHGPAISDKSNLEVGLSKDLAKGGVSGVYKNSTGAYEVSHFDPTYEKLRPTLGHSMKLKLNDIGNGASKAGNALLGNAHDLGNSMIRPMDRVKSYLKSDNLTARTYGDDLSRNKILQARKEVDGFVDAKDYGKAATALGLGTMAGGAAASTAAAIAAEQAIQGAATGTGSMRKLAAHKAAMKNAVNSYDRSLQRQLAKKTEYEDEGRSTSKIDKKINKLTNARSRMQDRLDNSVDKEVKSLKAKLIKAKTSGDEVDVARIKRRLRILNENY